MRIFRCDVCKSDVELAQLKGGTLTIRLGDQLLLNLPDTDRCVKCYDSVVSALRTVIASIDDTQHGKLVEARFWEKAAETDTDPFLDLTPLVDPVWKDGAP